MSNQETNNNIDLQKVQSVNIGRNNIIRPEDVLPVEIQTRTPIDKEYAKQLSKAHIARALGKSIELIAGKGLGLAEDVAFKKYLKGIDIGAKLTDLLLKATKEKWTLEKVTEKLNEILLGELDDNPDLDSETKSQIKKMIKIAKWYKALEPIYIDFQLGMIYNKENPTDKDLDFIFKNQAHGTIDISKNNIVDYIDADELLDNSNVIQIIDDMSEVVTKEILIPVVTEANRSENIFLELIKNVDFQGIVNFINNMLVKSDKNNSTTSTLAQADREEITYTPQHDLPLELAYEEPRLLGDNMAQAPTQPNLLGSLVNGLNAINPFAILKAKKEQELEKRCLAYAKSMKEYKAHIQRSIERDPSMEYFYSTKYQEETQFMYSGGASFSNINPSEANNFSSPVGGSFTSPFSSLSNEIAPLNIPPFLTVADVLKDPSFKEAVHIQSSNETYKQLCKYDKDLWKELENEPPISSNDRNTLDDAEELFNYIRHCPK